MELFHRPLAFFSEQFYHLYQQRRVFYEALFFTARQRLDAVLQARGLLALTHADLSH